MRVYTVYDLCTHILDDVVHDVHCEAHSKPAARKRNRLLGSDFGVF